MIKTYNPQTKQYEWQQPIYKQKVNFSPIDALNARITLLEQKIKLLLKK